MNNNFVKEQDSNYLEHHGILGQRWGIRRYQNADGSLTKAGQKRYQSPEITKKDLRWAKRKSEKITAKAKKQSQKELNAYGNELLKLPGALKANGKLSSKTIVAYNQKMAELMSKKVSDLRSPSGKAVSFVAKRGELGVFMSLSNQGYNPNQFKNGIYDSGRVAYRKTVLNKAEV